MRKGTDPPTRCPQAAGREETQKVASLPALLKETATVQRWPVVAIEKKNHFFFLKLQTKFICGICWLYIVAVIQNYEI